MYWVLAAEDEKGDQDRRDFQRVKDRSEDLRLGGELAQQKNKFVDREKTRLRVQNFRDRVREEDRGRLDTRTKTGDCSF